MAACLLLDTAVSSDLRQYTLGTLLCPRAHTQTNEQMTLSVYAVLVSLLCKIFGN
jgi:hypothetical protein